MPSVWRGCFESAGHSSSRSAMKLAQVLRHFCQQKKVALCKGVEDERTQRCVSKQIIHCRRDTQAHSPSQEQYGSSYYGPTKLSSSNYPRSNTSLRNVRSVIRILVPFTIIFILEVLAVQISAVNSIKKQCIKVIKAKRTIIQNNQLSLARISLQFTHLIEV